MDADDLVDLLANIQLNILGHIRSAHPEEMDKFKEKLRQNMLEMINKFFDEYNDFFKGEEWKWK